MSTQTLAFAAGAWSVPVLLLLALVIALLVAMLVLLLCKKRRARLICLGAAVVCAAAGAAMLLLPLRQEAEEPALRPGELNAQDFAGEWELSVLTGARLERPSAAPAQRNERWTVTDPALRAELYQLCTEITCYREVNRQTTDNVYDDGFADYTLYPSLSFDCGEIRYRIGILNWDGVAPGAAIAQEKSGEPVVWLRRMDDWEYLSSQLFPPDTLNGSDGCGWFSVMPQASMDRLLELLESVGVENAVPVEE